MDNKMDNKKFTLETLHQLTAGLTDELLIKDNPLFVELIPYKSKGTRRLHFKFIGICERGGAYADNWEEMLEKVEKIRLSLKRRGNGGFKKYVKTRFFTKEFKITDE